MTLEQIDRRLSLFPEYLEYFVEVKILFCDIFNPQQMMRTFRKTGIVFMVSGKLLDAPLKTFDEWLFEHGHVDLVIYENPQYICCIDPYDKGNFVFDPAGVVVWVSTPFGKFIASSSPNK